MIDMYDDELINDELLAAYIDGLATPEEKEYIDSLCECNDELRDTISMVESAGAFFESESIPIDWNSQGDDDAFDNNQFQVHEDHQIIIDDHHPRIEDYDDPNIGGFHLHDPMEINKIEDIDEFVDE